MSLYHFTNCLLVLAILVLFYVPNSLKVIITASTIATGTATFGGMLLTQYFSNCCNRSSDCVMRCSM